MTIGAKRSVAVAEQERFVRLSQPVGLSKLFRPLPKAKGPRPALNETYEYGDDLVLKFSAREALGVPEQTLLLALLELAHEQHRRSPDLMSLNGSSRSELAVELWSALNGNSPGWKAAAQPTVMLNCSWSELHRRCGSDSKGGTATESRRASLVRLCEVTVWETSKVSRTMTSSRLVSWKLGDDQRVHVALNHRLAAALLGPGYVKVFMTERLRLRSHVAMLLHAFLSTCLSPGKSLPFGYERLVERLWPNMGSAVNPSTHRRRLSDIRDALRDIGRLETWEVELERSKATVRRLKIDAGGGRRALLKVSDKEEATDEAAGQTAREMTNRRHFKVPAASYLERPFWPTLKHGADLPRYDEDSTTL